MKFGKRRDPVWYADWRESAFDELGDKQSRLSETYRIGDWARFDYDLETGRLTFSDESGPKVTCNVQVVGTVDTKDWLWGWANGHLPKGCTDRMLSVKAYGDEHNVSELASASVKANDLQSLGWMLTAAAVRLLDADGAYRPPNGFFMVCDSIGFVS